MQVIGLHHAVSVVRRLEAVNRALRLGLGLDGVHVQLPDCEGGMDEATRVGENYATEEAAAVMVVDMFCVGTWGVGAWRKKGGRGRIDLASGQAHGKQERRGRKCTQIALQLRSRTQQQVRTEVVAKFIDSPTYPRRLRADESEIKKGGQRSASARRER